MSAVAAMSAQNVKRRAGVGSDAIGGAGDGNGSVKELSDDTFRDDASGMPVEAIFTKRAQQQSLHT